MSDVPSTPPDPQAPPAFVPPPAAPAYPGPAPMPAAEPVGAPASAPPSSEGAKRSGMAAWIILAVVIALLVGAGIGYVASVPSKNDVTSQRDQLQAKVAGLEKDLDGVKDDLEKANTATGTATAARDKCSKAAIDAVDLIKQDQNLWSDFNALIEMTPGSAEELEQEQHMDNQADTMTAQSHIVMDELAACKAAVGT